MTISYLRLPKYFKSLDFPVEIHHKNSGTVWQSASRRDLEMLIALGLVYAVGTWTRVKKIHLDVPAEEVIRRIESRPEPSPTGLDLDLLQKMSTARKFILREHLFVVQGEDCVRSGRWVWAHKRLLVT